MTHCSHAATYSVEVLARGRSECSPLTTHCNENAPSNGGGVDDLGYFFRALALTQVRQRRTSWMPPLLFLRRSMMRLPPS